MKCMADWGFDFVRIPMTYPSYLDDPVSGNDITPSHRRKPVVFRMKKPLKVLRR